MSRLGLWIGLIFFLQGCNSNQIKIEGEITDLQGEVRLLTIVPFSLDTLVVVGQMYDTRVEWRLPELNMPAKMWIEADGERIVDFILDEREGMRIDGTIKNDSLVVSGGRLEEEYVLLKRFLVKKYQQPMEEIDRSIDRIVRRRNRTGSDEKRLSRLVTLKRRYEYYRNAYIKKMIRANLSHELSLVLIEEELKDSVDVQRQLFYELNIENKNSNLYQVLKKRLR